MPNIETKLPRNLINHDMRNYYEHKAQNSAAQAKAVRRTYLIALGKKLAAGLFIAAAFTAAAQSDSQTEAQSITGATTDNLMSDDMASYIVKYGHGKTFSELDMQ